MNTTRRISRKQALLVPLAMAIVAGLWWFWHPKPRFHGKDLDGWLEEFNRAGRLDKTGDASEAIRAMGTNALPYLIGYVRHQESHAKLNVYRFAWRHHFVWLPAPRVDPLLGPSFLALKALGPSAAPAIPEFVRMFENPATSARGGLALYMIGPASVPAFRRVCGHSNRTVRLEAAIYLALLPASYNGLQPFSCTWHPPIRDQRNRSGSTEFIILISLSI